MMNVSNQLFRKATHFVFFNRHRQILNSSRRRYLVPNRLFSSDKGTSDESKTPIEWRKKQLETLEQKFQEPLNIEKDDKLQPMWKQMESRVKHRKSRTIEETGGRTGRRNVKRTDEDMWLQEGLYDENREK